VPDAAIKLVNNGTQETFTAKTDNSGFFTITLIRPGNYTLTAEKSGFRAEQRTIPVAVGQNLGINLKLEIGNVSEVVQVESTPPQLQAENANLTTTFESDLVSKLPNPGNDLTAVAQTAPGVLMNTSSGGGYGNFTAFGLPATANLFTMNGNDENDPYLNLNNSGATNLLLGTNEVQEVAVVSNGYTGQYGRQAGAQVDYVTKTGSNQFHGNAVYFYNSGGMNANDFFNNSSNTALPHEVNNQWQVSVGGPIKKDKIFFFVDYEGLRYILGSSRQIIVPTPQFGAAVVANLPSFGVNNSAAFYQNMFTLWDGAPGLSGAKPVDNTIDGTGNLGCGDLNTSANNPAGSPLAGFQQFGGAAGSANPSYGFNGGGGTPCAEWFRSTVGALSKEWILAGNVDFQLNDANHVNVRARFDRGLQPTYTDPINSAFTVTSNQPQDEGQINWNHIFSPTKTNQLILSGLYYSAIFGPQANGAQSTFPGTLENFDTGAWRRLGGDSYVFPQGRNVTQIMVVDDFTWIVGNHTLRFGVNFRYNKISDYANTVLTHPLLGIISTTDFVEGLGDYILQGHPNLLSTSVGIYSVGFYGQDEWRVNPGLKLTLALRFDKNSNADCYQNCYSRLNGNFSDLNHDPTVPYSQMLLNNQAHPFGSIQAINVEPRAGFAWTPNSKFWKPGSTVIRGGAGLFTDLYPGTLQDNVQSNPTANAQYTIVFSGLPLANTEANNVYNAQTQCNTIFNSIANSANGTLAAYQTAAAAAGLAGQCTPPNIQSTNTNIKNPTYIEWNMQVQHAITNRLMVDVNYVGNHGYDLFVINPWPNAYSLTGQSFVGGLPAAPPDQRVLNVSNLTNSGISNYNGMSVSVIERALAGWQFRFNYTYSHTSDDVSNGGVLPYSLNNSYLVQLYPTNMHLNYGNSDYDVRHTISANYVWTMPFKFSHKALETLAGGWQNSGTFFYRAGLPFSVIDGLTPNFIGNALGANTSGVVLAQPLGNTPMTCGTSAINKPCLQLDQFVGAGSETGFSTQNKNFYRGPSYFNTDFSVLKNFTLTERLHFSLGANFFNILNHPNFANPVNDVSNGQLGSITSTVVPPTSPYGAFVGSAVSGREIQVMGRLTFYAFSQTKLRKGGPFGAVEIDAGCV
jgi:outer membrane receptor for ferrienterochelin and colicin